MKDCPDCGRRLPPESYGRNRALPGGLSFYCRDCNRARNRRWYRNSRREQGHEVRDLSWVPEGKRWCPTCRTAVDEADYSRNASTPSGFGAEWRPCRRSSQNEAYFVRRYGLTRAEVSAMRAAQGDRCAICGDQGAAHLDHAHTTGAVRALLCSRCNMGLGLFLDEPGRLLAAVAYLEKHAAGAGPPATGCTTTPPLGSDRRDRRGTRPGRRSTDRPHHGPAAPHRPATGGPAEEAHG